MTVPIPHLPPDAPGYYYVLYVLAYVIMMVPVCFPAFYTKKENEAWDKLRSKEALLKYKQQKRLNHQNNKK